MSKSKGSSKGAECVKVVIRCRPLNSKEKEQGHQRIVEMDVKGGVVEVKSPKPGELPKKFTFDSVYDWDSKQCDLYDETFRDLVESVLNGFNGTIFAYGQTGTGKTFTMQGVKTDPDLRGVIPNSFEHIYQHIARAQNQQYLVRASYIEIYQEEIRDLLNKDQNKKFELKESPDTGVYVKGVTACVAKSIKELERAMDTGNANRAVGATNMNEHSSRSHAIMVVTIECSEDTNDGENHIRVGKLNMVDLAGSERQTKTGATGDRLKEATKINLSLSALGNVISALVDGKSSHIPYRDSKLTRLLQDSLGGNAKTVMVANIGPASYNYDETITTLRYANRAKNIKNKPKINEDPKDALLREFQEKINRLKEQLQSKGGPRKKRKKKKRQRIGPDGETIEEEIEDETEEDDEGDEVDEEEYIKQQQSKLEEEKNAILNNASLIAEEKERLLKEAQGKEEALRKEKEAKNKLAEELKLMESKLLRGGKNIVDHTNEQQRALEQRRQEIAEQKRKEREMQQALAANEEKATELQDTYVSLEQEVEVKTKKLKKLFAKLQQTKQEIQDLQEEHVQERQEMEQTQNELTRDLKLKMLIIENFIPPEEKNKILNRAMYDEEEDSWRLQPHSKMNPAQMAKRPISAAGNRRPISEYAKMAAAMGGNPFRYKGENILCLELDMPNRTTRDYEGPCVAPRVQAALDAALQDEEDIDIDGSNAIFGGKSKPKAKKREKSAKDRPKTASKRNQSQNAKEMFPTSRGLVPK
ncbi:kinesin-II 95 kDa subunit [Lingula anatina]|uniref:Kinesin-like protein n=1 Tax=Lingula anatina TaxID=7574 RepID=A0A1S3H321_LINAN|nr:kinesin-II 95 kDa subunit [Lingula anatina]|eukprot:XP_013380347.1 kinesin-II 95 kDa subunit [Lingula anatina]